MSSRTKLVAYLPSLRTILQRLRATSTVPIISLDTKYVSDCSYSTEERAAAILDRMATKDVHEDAMDNHDLVAFRLHPHFSLPGATGFSPVPSQPSPSSSLSPSLSLGLSPSPGSPPALLKSSPVGTVECLVQECPQRLLPGFSRLFPGISFREGRFLVITLTEKTLHDMTGWSFEVEEERDALLEHFVESAKEICTRLKSAGHWADFIDPSSGRAFYSPYSNETLFETDERFGHLGFEILDLGCCKCVSHSLWGSHTFVGALFTDAVSSSPALSTIMHL